MISWVTPASPPVRRTETGSATGRAGEVAGEAAGGGEAAGDPGAAEPGTEGPPGAVDGASELTGNVLGTASGEVGSGVDVQPATGSARPRTTATSSARRHRAVAMRLTISAGRSPRRTRRGGAAQETAAFTSSVTCFCTAGLQARSAYATGQKSPSSRVAGSWKPSVEYR
ncbi:hypothetical protein GA0070611_2297 [Micromonospora auratinigra]|uniref:Uncharacterized protein n=1 Tax=Micromonospora auratinigra TaxID=261654 RepID=A0A1A8ZHQ3_9ACTN|nr:hypothetical protein GA0070611_2297 [Micromonospora auratinigra]